MMENNSLKMERDLLHIKWSYPVSLDVVVERYKKRAEEITSPAKVHVCA